MEKNPHKIITADNITWEVTRDSEGLYVAKGDLSVPVEMRFKLDDNGELIKQKVVIDGKKRFDAREQEEKTFDPLSTVNVDEELVNKFAAVEISLNIRCGAIIYINGEEIRRIRMPMGD